MVGSLLPLLPPVCSSTDLLHPNTWVADHLMTAGTGLNEQVHIALEGLMQDAASGAQLNWQGMSSMQTTAAHVYCHVSL